MRRVLVCFLIAVLCGNVGYIGGWLPAWIAAAVFLSAAVLATRTEGPPSPPTD